MAAPAQRALSVEMEEATSALHERLMHHPFERAISSGQFKREEYVQYLSDFCVVFHAIETRVLAWSAACDGVWDERLARTASIERDLAFFSASPSSPPPSPAARAYANYISLLPDSNLYLLVAHIWTQYGKEMAGGQYFKKNVQKCAAAICGEQKEGTGALLYEFDIPQLRTWRVSWRAAMDALELSPTQRKEVVDECVSAFLRTESILPTHIAL